VRIALGCLAAYTALSFLSILWAAVPGDAWEGANRTLLYLLVFALFAAWRQRGASAALLLGAWTLAMIGVAAFTALHLDAIGGSLEGALPGGRLVYPADYVNADAAQWLIAFWPAVMLARSERLPWGLRGVLAGGAVVLADVALLSQSRGALYATAAMLVLVFTLAPGRARTFALLAPVALGIAVTVPSVLHVGERLQNGGDAHTAVHDATVAMFAAALLVGLAVAAGAWFESRRGPGLSPAAAARVRRAIGAVALVTLLAVLAGGVVAAGDPVARVRHAWDTFKDDNGENGYAANGSGNRLLSGLGSNRYDFYRVALDEFAAHPLVGIGTDNFAEPYLRHGRSIETPHYPHSVELRTLSQTGLVGALLALAGLAAALTAGWRGMRRADPLGRAVAAAALTGFAYWAVHGSVDWLWEFAGLGAPAFALLGLACALAPAGAGGRVADAAPGAGPAQGTEAEATTTAHGMGGRLGRRWAVAGALVAVAAAISLALPWLSQREIQSAAAVWARAPLSAYARLDSAARLDPLSDEPYLVAGDIALRRRELARADHEFALALARTPGDAYATLERGAIASAAGDRRDALTLLERAALLNPRDPLTQAALTRVREGRRVNIEELNRSILHNAQQLS